jgi:deoxyribonuclease V
MRVRRLHDWDLTPRDAMALQRELAARVVARGDPPEAAVRFIAGCDVAFEKARDRAVGAVVVLRYPELDVVERVVAQSPIAFPYVPGLLSFRETPLLAQAFEQLEHAPDLVMVDGHGYAHPRRFGIACHIGLLLDVPAIGVAKSRLVGEEGAVAATRGSRADLIDGGDVIGSLLRTRDGVRPIYVSVGHQIALDAAERWVLRCGRAHRLPEPTRLADQLAGEAKRSSASDALGPK